MLILMSLFMSTISMPLQSSDIDKEDVNIGIKISITTVFQGPETMSLDLFLKFKFDFVMKILQP